MKWHGGQVSVRMEKTEEVRQITPSATWLECWKTWKKKWFQTVFCLDPCRSKWVEQSVSRTRTLLRDTEVSERCVVTLFPVKSQKLASIRNQDEETTRAASFGNG